MSIIQKILLFIAVFEASGTPIFQGISFQRGFDINFKPLPWKPIEFLTEKWSPLGVFGKKFSLHKRSLDDMVPPRPPERVPRPAAPVFEHVEEIEHIGPAPIFILPKPINMPPVPPPAPIPEEIPKPLPPQPVPPVSSPKPPPPLPVPMPIIVNELPPLPEKPHALPPINTNMVVIKPTKIINSHEPFKSERYTDITKVESVAEHIKPPPPFVEPKPPVPPAPIGTPPIEPVPPPVVAAPPPPVQPVPPPPVEPIPPPPVEPNPPQPVPIKEDVKEETIPVPITPEVPKTEIFLKDSALIRGSKMALQFGTVFLSLMAQFFDNARASIDLMTNPPPKFNP